MGKSASTTSILLAFPLIFGAFLSAQTSDVAIRQIRDDAIRGQSLIRSLLDRLGGEEALKALKSIHYSMEGNVRNGLQGFDPASVESDRSIGSTTYTIDLDYSQHQYRRRILQVLPGEIRLDAVTYFKDGIITTAYPGGRHMTQTAGPESSLAEVLGIPALFARRALANISSATLVGRSKEDGQLTDIVEISWDPNTRVRAFLNAKDHSLLRLELAGTDPLIGDDDVFYAFDGERTASGITFPKHVTFFRRGQPYVVFNVTDIAVNPTLDTSLFDLPNYEPLTTATNTNPLGGGAYEITGLDGGVFRVIFFDLGDSVAVFDAPISRLHSQSIAAQIRKTVGDKPIKYVIVSHFHDDHLAGIGYYVDHGSQIVTTRANAPVIQRYARVESKLHPDLPAEGRTPSFVFVDGENLELKGATGSSLTVYKLSTCPHAKDMLMAYLPSQKLLVQADLFVELAAYSPTSAALSDWMKQPTAPPIEHIIGTHLGLISRQAFEASAASAHS